MNRLDVDTERIFSVVAWVEWKVFDDTTIGEQLSVVNHLIKVDWNTCRHPDGNQDTQIGMRDVVDCVGAVVGHIIGYALKVFTSLGVKLKKRRNLLEVLHENLSHKRVDGLFKSVHVSFLPKRKEARGGRLLESLHQLAFDDRLDNLRWCVLQN